MLKLCRYGPKTLLRGHIGLDFDHRSPRPPIDKVSILHPRLIDVLAKAHRPLDPVLRDKADLRRVCVDVTMCNNGRHRVLPIVYYIHSNKEPNMPRTASRKAQRGFFLLPQLLALEYPLHLKRARKEGFCALSREQFKKLSIRAMTHMPAR